MSWTDLSVKLKREVAGRLDFMSRRSMSQTTRLNREIVDSTRISVPRVKIVVDDSDYFITMYTGIEKFLKIEIKKGYDQKTVVSRSENNSETVQSKPTEKSTMDVFVEILASFFKTEAVDIGVLEWDFKQHAVLGSENDMKMKKRQGIFVNVLSSKIEKSTGGSTVFHTEKLVISDKCASDFTKGLLNLCDKEYLDSMKVLTLTSIEKASKTGAWCDVYTENAESFYSQGVFYEEVPCVDKFLMTTSHRTTNWSTLRFARLNEKAMKIWSRAGSVLSRTPDKKEFKIVREKAEKKILLHKKTECGYSITVYTDEKFDKLGGMKWFETEFMQRPNERDQLIAQYEQLYLEVSQLAENFTKKMIEEIKKLRDSPQTKEIKTGLMKCKELANGANALVETVKSMLLKLKKSEEFGVDVIRVRIGQILEAKSRLEASMKLFGSTGSNNKLPLQHIEREILIAQCEQLFPEVSHLSVVVLAKMSEVSKKLEGVPLTATMKTAMKPWKEWTRAFRDLPRLTSFLLNQFKNSSNQVGLKVIREKIDSIQNLKIRLEKAKESAEAMGGVSEDVVKTPDAGKAKLVAQCSQLFPEVATLLIKLTGIVTQNLKRLKDARQTKAVKTEIKDCRELLKSIDGCSPANLLKALKKIRNDEVEVETIREMIVQVQSIRRKMEAEVKRFEGMGIYADVGEEEATARKIQVLNPVVTSENHENLEDKNKSEDGASGGKTAAAAPDGKTTTEDAFGASEPDVVKKIDVAHQILNSPVVSEDPDNVIKTPDEKNDSKAINLVTEKAELVAQCKQLFPEVATSLIKLTDILTQYLKRLKGGPRTKAVKTEIKYCKEVLKSIDDCSPADLLEALKKIRDDEVEVEQIREMMVPVQSIRGKLEVEMKRLEGLGICAVVGEENLNDEKSVLIAQCEQLFSEVSQMASKLLRITTKWIKRLEDKPQKTDEYKNAVESCQNIANYCKKIPGCMKDFAYLLKISDVGAEEVRVEITKTENIKRKLEERLQQCQDYGYDSEDSEDVNKDSKKLNEEKSALIAQCEQLFPEVSRMASKLMREMTNMIKQIKGLPRKTEALKNVLEACQTISNNCKPVPECMTEELTYLLKNSDEIGVKVIREKLGTAENMKHVLEDKLKKYEDDSEDPEDVNKDSKKLNEEKSALIAQCKQLFPETGQVASRLMRKMTKLIKRIEDLPQKTDACKKMLETCQIISNYCEPIPEKMKNGLTYLLENSDNIEVDEIRDTMGELQDIKHVLEIKLKQCEKDSEDSEDVTKAPDNKKKTTVILNYEKYLLISECEQLFPEVIQMASTLVSKLSKLIKLSEGLELKTEKQKNAVETCLEVLKMCEPVSESTMNLLTYLLENSNKIGVEYIREALENAQEKKIQLEEWLSTFENHKLSNCFNTGDVVDTVSLQKERKELSAEFVQLAEDVIQIAMNFSTKLSETAEICRTRVAKPAEFKEFRESCEKVAEQYKNHSKKFADALNECKKNDLVKKDVGEIRQQILKLQAYKAELENDVETIAVKLWKKDCKNAPDVKTMAITDGVFEDVIKTPDDKKDYEAMNPAAGRAELVAHCEKLIPEVAQSVIKFLGFLTKYIERLEDAPQTDDVKADLKDCKYVLKPIEGLPAKLRNVLRRIKGDDTFDVEEIRETMVKVHGIRREMATGMKRFEGMDMDVGEQENGKETTDGVYEDVIKTPNDKKDSEAKNPDCEEASEKPDVFQTIGKKMFGSIPEANALVDPRSRKARSINPDDYDYVGSMYPDDFTHYLEHRRKLENRDFDFDCSWARLQFLAVFFFVLFSILFVVLWIETFVY
ncbi:hypothetical protein GCK72_021217 [Caenorhabditis remanei]|uniref:Uncharacterized protein n=1 Tax=Caenorhabditis remanei TaxID=31234 RepID=A0A6A5GIN7_CAERE|nr:hypothetical protein GCK72_021217 [Caenorhabditis remanei]KAF1754654.1 hypothetical protein GCK72_021217 [Caenorhabditis remanei]